MKKGGLVLTVTLSIVTFLTIALTGCIFIPGWSPLIGRGPVVTGSQEMATWEMDFADFTDIDVSSAFEVDITRSDSYFVSITANANLLDYLDIRQTGQTLYIGLKPASYISTRQEATITLPELLELKLSGASRGRISGFSSTSPLELDLSGASSLNIEAVEAGATEFGISGASHVTGNIETANCKFDLSGASKLELTGSGNDADIKASGASTVRLADFPITNAEVDLSGASNATVTLSGRLDVNLSGASNLNYSGNPTLGDIEVSGSSRISKK